MRNDVATSQLLLGDDHLILDFPYDPEQVKEIKQIEGAKWDKAAKVWRVPMPSIEAARRFGQRHQFWIDPEVLRFDLTTPKIDAIARLDQQHIAITFPYDPVKVQAIKRFVPGAFFDNKAKCWKVPRSSSGEALEWCVKFGIVVEPEVLSMHRQHTETTSALVDASRSVEDHVDIPTFNGTLRPYQHAGVAYALTARRCFIADDMGTGKTAMSLATLEAADAWPAVVVCPATLTLNWEAECNKWLPHRTVSVVRNRKEMPEPADLIVVGWSNITVWEDLLKKFNGYVFDESHYAKSHTAQRTKSAIKIAKTVTADGVVLCLTGTPITNRPAEYASQLEILGKLNEFGGRINFWTRYCGAFKDRWGQWHTDGASNLTELNDRLRASCYIRRTKDQVLKDLPPMLENRILVEPDPKVMVEYRKAEADIAKFLAERAAEIARELGANPKSAAVMARIKAESAEHLVRIATLRQLAAQAKMKAVTEWVETLLDAGNKVVLAAHHRDVVSELASRFGGLKIQGGQDIDEIEDMKSRFQNNPAAKVITLSIQAAKTGHTLTAAQDIGFVELPFTPADLDQTSARLHRIGQQGVVTSHILLAAGTIDTYIWDLIQSKRSVVNAATDGGELDDSESLSASLTAHYTQLGLDTFD
mgnify:CR=1 FL=1